MFIQIPSLILTYILKSFIQHFTHIQFNITPKTISTSSKWSLLPSKFPTKILCAFLIPRVFYTLRPALLVFFGLIAPTILVTEWKLQTGSTLGLCNSIFFPATSSVLEQKVDMKTLCSEFNSKVWRPSLKDCLTFEDGTDGLSGKVGNHPTLRNIPEERISQRHRGGSLKSRT